MGTPPAFSPALAFPESAGHFSSHDKLDCRVVVDVCARQPHRHQAPVGSAVIVKIEAGSGTTVLSRSVSPDPRVRRSGPAGRRKPGLPSVTRGLAFVIMPCDVYDAYVVRKQLYICDEHERALQARARELGVSEAELVRRLLDGLLRGEGRSGLARAGAAEALEGFLEEADQLAESPASPKTTSSTRRSSSRTAFEAAIGDVRATSSTPTSSSTPWTGESQ